MPYYNICEICGATLDPGERCTCKADKKEKEEQAKINKMVQFTMQMIKRGKKK
jgi:hypothetical protein